MQYKKREDPVVVVVVDNSIGSDPDRNYTMKHEPELNKQICQTCGLLHSHKRETQIFYFIPRCRFCKIN